jgi:hypothetical protein
VPLLSPDLEIDVIRSKDLLPVKPTTESIDPDPTDQLPVSSSSKLV